MLLMELEESSLAELAGLESSDWWSSMFSFADLFCNTCSDEDDDDDAVEFRASAFIANRPTMIWSN